MAKAKYFMQCDRMRMKPNGEAIWREMMKKRRTVEQSTFERNVDPKDLLDEDETLSDFIAGDPEAVFYKSDVRGIKVWFIQMAGFEFIFTQHERYLRNVLGDENV